MSHWESCVRCGKGFPEQEITASGRCPECEKCGVQIYLPQYNALKAHAEAMAHAIEQIPEHGFWRAMELAKEYKEWANE